MLTFYHTLCSLGVNFMPFNALWAYYHVEKKWVFRHLSMFWRKAKQEKQRKTNIARIFMESYAVLVNFMLFYDFDLKFENFMLFHILCQVADLR